MKRFDVAVVGGGLAGTVAALAFARYGFSTAHIAPPPPANDERTTALMESSLAFLSELGLIERVLPLGAALRTMRIIDGTKRLFRAPTVSFRASEIGLEAFGYNFPNAPLLKALAEAATEEPTLTTLPQAVTGARIGTAGNHLTLADGEEIEASLLLGADGRRSLVREAAGIAVRRTPYPQTALVLNFTHTLHHDDISTEFHTETGPCTQVPLGFKRSSLVWVVSPEDARNLVDMTMEALNRRIEERLGSMLGAVSIEAMPQAWPLSAETAERFGRDGAVLVGEAAHVFPPIGAQGLNLSLRDIRSAVTLARDARTAGQPLQIGDAYDRMRRTDIVSRTASIDVLNRSLLSGFLPVHMLRAAGLQLLSSVPPLRQIAMHEGIAPGRSLKVLPEMLRRGLSRRRA